MIHTSNTVSEQQDQLTQQLLNGFQGLRFTNQLEPGFQKYQALLIKRRLPMVAIFSLLLLILYAAADYLFLPDNIWQYTISVRFGMLIPVVLLALIMIRWMEKWRTIALTTFFGYLWMGVGIIAIIAGAQLEGYDLPYDGLYSVLLFGFFLLGMPFKMAVISSWGLWFLYGFVEILIGHTEHIIAQMFFISSMCTIGTVGGYIQEQILRTGYLKHQLIKLSRQQAITDTQAKTHFLAAAGHDLRQPINAINLISDALQQTQDKSMQKMLSERLSTSVDMLNRLLDSLLEFSRLEMGAVTEYKEIFEVDELLKSIGKAMETQLEASQIALDSIISQSVKVNSDPLLLERIIQNLVNNVIRHADADKIKISMRLFPSNLNTADTKSGTLRVSIEDNGCGIEQQHLESIFDEYFQVTPNREVGMGLGLSIVKQLAALLNIQLIVESEQGKGSTFHLEFSSEHLVND